MTDPWISKLAWFLAALLSTTVAGQETTAIRLTDVTDTCGVNFVHTDGGTGKRYIVESVVAGMATLDFDCDGYIDIYFVNGMNLDSSAKAPAAGNALFRNNGDFTFTDVTRQAGLTEIGYGMGVVCADSDHDGDPDLYVSNFGQNTYYQNNGDGTFTNATEAVHLQMPDKVGAGCSMLDIENDGDLDLFVGSYVQFTLDQHIQRVIGNHQFHPGPVDYSPSPDALFRNDGDGTFTDISQHSGILAHSSYSMGVVAFDVDSDGDIDIFVGNDQRANTLWINDGTGRFEDQALLSGLAFDRMGRGNGNMGVDVGDINGDQLLDIFTTTYQDEMPVLYLNLGDGLFMDQTNVLRIDNRLHPHVTWGCAMVDFDNDADLDIYVACGHFMDNIQHIDDRTTVKVRDFVLENRQGKFVDVTSSVGSGLEIVESSRGAVFDDLDNDGDIDAIILNWNSSPTILRNDTPTSSRGFMIDLVGVASNRSAVGAKLQVVGEQSSQVKQIVAGRGYQSQFGIRQHFVTQVEGLASIEVLWPSKHGETFVCRASPRPLTLVEGFGVPLPNGALPPR